MAQMGEDLLLPESIAAVVMGGTALTGGVGGSIGRLSACWS